MDKGDSVLLVAKNNEKVGFTQLYPTFSSISMKNAWILNDSYARKQEIGKMLLYKAKDYFISTWAKSISLSTAPDNYSAQRLYEKNGYEQDSQFYHYELSLT